MSLDQFVVAVLGHLAWRTPFAEDMEPWEHWSPDQPRLTAVKRDDPHLDTGTAGSPDRRIDPPS